MNSYYGDGFGCSLLVWEDGVNLKWVLLIWMWRVGSMAAWKFILVQISLVQLWGLWESKTIILYTLPKYKILFQSSSLRASSNLKSYSWYEIRLWNAWPLATETEYNLFQSSVNSFRIKFKPGFACNTMISSKLMYLLRALGDLRYNNCSTLEDFDEGVALKRTERID